MRDEEIEFARQAHAAYVLTQYLAAQQRREAERLAREGAPLAADMAVRRYLRRANAGTPDDPAAGSDGAVAPAAPPTGPAA